MHTATKNGIACGIIKDVLLVAFSLWYNQGGTFGRVYSSARWELLQVIWGLCCGVPWCMYAVCWALLTLWLPTVAGAVFSSHNQSGKEDQLTQNCCFLRTFSRVRIHKKLEFRLEKIRCPKSRWKVQWCHNYDIQMAANGLIPFVCGSCAFPICLEMVLLEIVNVYPLGMQNKAQCLLYLYAFKWSL